MSAVGARSGGGSTGTGGGRGRSDEDSARGTRTVVAWLLGTVAVVVVVVVLLPSTPRPYAITNEEADGTDLLRRVLDDLGVEMVEGAPDDVLGSLRPVDVAVVLRDRLSDADEASLARHVHDGGDLVIAAPRSALAGELPVVAGQGVDGPPGCDLLPERMDVSLAVDAFAGIGPEDVPDVFEVPDDAMTTCWESEGTALVARVPAPPLAGRGGGTGAETGTTTVLADPDVVVNGAVQAQPVLGQFAHLFLPDDARTATGDGDQPGRVVVVVGRQAPPPGATPVGAVPDDLRTGMWLVVVAAGLYALSRARRHGRVVAENPPVEVPASELAAGIAELLQRHGEAGSAASRIRAELRAEVAPRVGATAAAEPALADLVVRATGLDRATVEAAVLDIPVAGPDGLLGVTTAVARVRRAMFGERSFEDTPRDVADGSHDAERPTTTPHPPRDHHPARSDT